MNLIDSDFAPVMNYPAPSQMKVFDLSEGLDEEYIRSFEWGIGRYNEKRQNMYTTDQFGGMRNIHMGIDIWAAAGAPVFSFGDGTVLYKTNNDRPGDYGPTLVLGYEVEDGQLYALYGHLSKMTLQNIKAGDQLRKGQKIATIGDKNENGGWPPHLHFQLAVNDPGKADMPGVVSGKNLSGALKNYPDPRKILGPLY